MDDGEVDAGLGELDGDRRASMAGSCWRRGMSREPAIATSRELACGSWEPERLMAHDGCTDAAKADVRRLEAWEADGRRRTVAVRVQLGVADRPSGLGR